MFDLIGIFTRIKSISIVINCRVFIIILVHVLCIKSVLERRFLAFIGACIVLGMVWYVQVYSAVVDALWELSMYSIGLTTDVCE